tara:strand:+ start:79 stop:690 length:612 start_codon:yes stop_codon:yes gene_type:complete
MAKKTKKQVAAEEVRDGKSLTTRGKSIRSQADSVAARKAKVKNKLADQKQAAKEKAAKERLAKRKKDTADKLADKKAKIKKSGAKRLETKVGRATKKAAKKKKAADTATPLGKGREQDEARRSKKRADRVVKSSAKVGETREKSIAQTQSRIKRATSVAASKGSIFDKVAKGSIKRSKKQQGRKIARAKGDTWAQRHSGKWQK